MLSAFRLSSRLLCGLLVGALWARKDQTDCSLRSYDVRVYTTLYVFKTSFNAIIRCIMLRCAAVTLRRLWMNEHITLRWSRTHSSADETSKQAAPHAIVCCDTFLADLHRRCYGATRTFVCSVLRVLHLTKRALVERLRLAHGTCAACACEACAVVFIYETRVNNDISPSLA